MTTLPGPLTPPDSDLQDFHFMPLHVARLRDSDFAATEDPEACWYGVLLWSASWHQIPAASLPDDDAVLTRLCGLGRDLKTFKRHRRGALRGFVRCSDGRLYHPVVAEQARAAWRSKIEQRFRSECARGKKTAQRSGGEYVAPTFDCWFATQGLAPLVPKTEAACPEGQPALSLGTTPPCPEGQPPPVPRDTPPLSLGTMAPRDRDRDRDRDRESLKEKIPSSSSVSETARAPDDDDDDDGSDVVSIAHSLCRQAGVSVASPKAIATAAQLVRDWQQAGATPSRMRATIAEALPKATEPVSSLRYFDKPIRHAIALEANRHEPTAQRHRQPKPGTTASAGGELGRMAAAVAAVRAERMARSG